MPWNFDVSYTKSNIRKIRPNLNISLAIKYVEIKCLVCKKQIQVKRRWGLEFLVFSTRDSYGFQSIMTSSGACGIAQDPAHVCKDTHTRCEALLTSIDLVVVFRLYIIILRKTRWGSSTIAIHESRVSKH